MNRVEQLEQNAFDNDIDVVSYPFNSERIKGLYCDNVIAVNASAKMTLSEKTCVLAEELGHYHTTVGNILDQSLASNRKQELRARVWAYNHLIGLIGIIKAFEHHCDSLNSMADYLGVTEKFLEEALAYYKSKYGIYTYLDNYIIYFEPNLGVMKLFDCD